MRIRIVAGAATMAAAAVLAACSSVVQGSGRTQLTSGPLSNAPSANAPAGGPTSGLPTPSLGTSPGTPNPVPSAPTSATPVATSCPHVVYPHAKLSFTCITSGMSAAVNGEVWPLQEEKTVEASTQWVLEEGAGHWGTPEGQSLASIANEVRQRMIDTGGYGDHPTVTTVADRNTHVGGAAAHLLQTTFTINRVWAKTAGTKVRHERLWIVALQVGHDNVSLWYASIPDLARSLWPKVPAAIRSIRVR